MLERLYTCEEIAERYSVKVTTVWDWISTKKLSAISIGRGYRVRESDLLNFEQQNRTVDRKGELADELRGENNV